MDMAALKAIVEPVVTGLGFAPVRVQINGGAGVAVLQIMAEDPGTGQLTLDQCAAISHALDPVLDAADPIDGEYRLEVSSPGIDRPLTRPADWDRWAGHRARVTVEPPIDGRKRFDGIVRGLADGAGRLEISGQGEIALPFAYIAAAKLALTDELIAATKPLSAEGADAFLKDAR